MSYWRQAILALNEAKREGTILVWYQSAMKADLHMAQRQLHQLREWLAGAALPLETLCEAMRDEQGVPVTAVSLRWQVSQQPCDVGWMQERGVLGPVMARWLTEEPCSGTLLVRLHQPAQLALCWRACPLPQGADPGIACADTGCHPVWRRCASVAACWR